MPVARLCAGISHQPARSPGPAAIAPPASAWSEEDEPEAEGRRGEGQRGERHRPVTLRPVRRAIDVAGGERRRRDQRREVPAERCVGVERAGIAADEDDDRPGHAGGEAEGAHRVRLLEADDEDDGQRDDRRQRLEDRRDARAEMRDDGDQRAEGNGEGELAGDERHSRACAGRAAAAGRSRA